MNNGRTKMEMVMVRIYLIHGYRLLIEAMAQRLKSRREVHLSGAAEDVDQALEEILALPVDLVLLDLSVGRDRALALHREMRRTLPAVKLLPLGLPDEQTVLDFLEAGASGYVLHDRSFEEMMGTLLAVHRGQPPCSPEVAAYVCARIAELAAEREQRIDLDDAGLTPRERQVLKLAAKNLRNQEIATRLEIALATVKNHIHSILGKLQVSGRREAVRRAYEGGLIS